MQQQFFRYFSSYFYIQLLWLSLKHRFGGCGHGFGECDGFNGFSGYGGFSGFGGFGRINCLSEFSGFGGFGGFSGFGF